VILLDDPDLRLFPGGGAVIAGRISGTATSRNFVPVPATEALEVISTSALPCVSSAVAASSAMTSTGRCLVSRAWIARSIATSGDGPTIISARRATVPASIAIRASGTTGPAAPSATARASSIDDLASAAPGME
jgi:hypothetical protein